MEATFDILFQRNSILEERKNSKQYYKINSKYKDAKQNEAHQIIHYI